MLAKDPQDRISCEEALQHPWITGESMIEDKPLDVAENLESLTHFTDMSKKEDGKSQDGEYDPEQYKLLTMTPVMAGK